MSPQLYYRIVEVRHSGGVTECGDPIPGDPENISLRLRSFPVVSKTPKGVWIEVYGERKFILSSATKRFADATIEEALSAFKARKKSQIRILTARLRQANQALFLADLKKGDGSW